MAPEWRAIRVEEAHAYRIHRVARLLRKHLMGLSKRRGVELLPEQWFVLNRLRHRDGCSQVELTDELFGDRPNLTRMLRTMEARGWVTRKPDPDDGRATRVYLTADGRRAHDRFAGVVQGERRRLFEGISDDDLATFDRVLARLESNIQREVQP